MKECRNCELAIYCFSEPSTWVFRTKQEMEEKQASILNCSIYRQTHERDLSVAQGCCSSVGDLRS